MLPIPLKINIGLHDGKSIAHLYNGSPELRETVKGHLHTCCVTERQVLIRQRRPVLDG
ncbi:hypothetical protein SAMN05216489_02748 [Streptomyces sp. 3213]|nr:hypothetical protein SAMN05216489_02748 [Streptomyces sp. 3213] [Streptomyces sp. 3213.3]